MSELRYFMQKLISNYTISEMVTQTLMLMKKMPIKIILQKCYLTAVVVKKKLSSTKNKPQHSK
jgi:hypothetical protein